LFIYGFPKAMILRSASQPFEGECHIPPGKFAEIIKDAVTDDKETTKEKEPYLITRRVV